MQNRDGIWTLSSYFEHVSFESGVSLVENNRMKSYCLRYEPLDALSEKDTD